MMFIPPTEIRVSNFAAIGLGIVFALLGKITLPTLFLILLLALDFRITIGGEDDDSE